MLGQMQKWITIGGIVQICCGVFYAHAAPIVEIAVCLAPNAAVAAQKLAENIELELELIDRVVIEKCSTDHKNQRKKSQIAAVITVSAHPNKHGKYEITGMAHNVLVIESQMSTNTSFDSQVARFVKTLMAKLKKPREKIEPRVTIISEVIEPSHLPDLPTAAKSEPPPLIEKLAVTAKRAPRLFMGINVGGETWHYGFTPTNTAISVPPLKTKAHPRIFGTVEWWPLAWLGIETEGGAAVSVFRMQTSGINLPETRNIWARQYGGAATIRTAYRFGSGFGMALRSGYRFWGTFSDVQQVADTVYTIVPSFQMHAFEIGGEFFFHSNQKKIDIKMTLAALPLMYYEEKPDNPGAHITPFGFGAQLSFRRFVNDNLFITLDLRGIGLYGIYGGEGNRITVHRKQLNGGILISYLFGLSAGLGCSF